MFKPLSLAGFALAISATTSMAATNITWWHGMAGRNGEVINEVAQKFNAAQSTCAITPVSKGTYEEALASGIAAFRSGEQPNILQVFDAGAATIINAPNAVIPAEDLITGARHLWSGAWHHWHLGPDNNQAMILRVLPWHHVDFESPSF